MYREPYPMGGTDGEPERDDVYKRIAAFHAHLDVCEQCRNHTFALCPTGEELLKNAATKETIYG